MIFVFGSNLAGMHGGGAASAAVKMYGAQMGVGVGRQGNSYAIPTMDHRGGTLTIEQIHPHVDAFLDYARKNPGLEFCVSQVGCGIARFRAEAVAPLFRGATANVLFDSAWTSHLEDTARFWGTFP